MHYTKIDRPISTDNSFVELFFHYAKGLVVYATEFLHSREDAEDVVHDVFVNLWERMETIDPQTVKAYLFRATRNMCLNHISHRKVVTKHRQNGDDVTENYDYYIQSELSRLLDEAIERLPPQRRQVFILSRLEGKSSGEIADEMNISCRTVDKHIQLSSKQIKDYIAKYLYVIFTGLV